MLNGLLLCLVCATYPPSHWDLLLDLVLLAFVLYLFYRVLGPDSNDVAFVEWTLTTCIAVYAAIVTTVLSRPRDN